MDKVHDGAGPSGGAGVLQASVGLAQRFQPPPPPPPYPSASACAATGMHGPPPPPPPPPRPSSSRRASSVDGGFVGAADAKVRAGRERVHVGESAHALQALACYWGIGPYQRHCVSAATRRSSETVRRPVANVMSFPPTIIHVSSTLKPCWPCGYVMHSRRFKLAYSNVSTQAYALLHRVSRAREPRRVVSTSGHAAHRKCHRPPLMAACRWAFQSNHQWDRAAGGRI
eukprot:363066-Chlamydomonas_euryale.AAC.13